MAYSSTRAKINIAKIKQKQMDTLGEYVKVGQGTLDKLEEVRRGINEVEQGVPDMEIHKIAEIFRNMFHYEVSIKEQIWNPRRLIKKIEEFLKENSVKCNGGVNWEKYAVHIHWRQNYNIIIILYSWILLLLRLS